MEIFEDLSIGRHRWCLSHVQAERALLLLTPWRTVRPGFLRVMWPCRWSPNGIPIESLQMKLQLFDWRVCFKLESWMVFVKVFFFLLGWSSETPKSGAKYQERMFPTTKLALMTTWFWRVIHGAPNPLFSTGFCWGILPNLDPSVKLTNTVPEK